MSWIMVVVHTLMSEWLYQHYGMAKKRITLRFLVAILVGSLVFWSNQNLSLVTLGVVLTYIAITDYSVQKIPNIMLVYLFLIKLMDMVIVKDKWIEHSIAGILFLMVMVLLYRLSKGGLGAGDVKLIAVLAFYLGIEQTCLVLILACGLIIGYAVLRWLLKKHHWRVSVPMAPFVLVSYLIHSIVLLGGL